MLRNLFWRKPHEPIIRVPTLAEELVDLAGSNRLRDQLAAARHPETPLEGLKVLLGSRNMPVMQELLERDHLPFEIIREGCNVGSPQVRKLAWQAFLRWADEIRWNTNQVLRFDQRRWLEQDNRDIQQALFDLACAEGALREEMLRWVIQFQAEHTLLGGDTALVYRLTGVPFWYALALHQFLPLPNLPEVSEGRPATTLLLIQVKAHLGEISAADMIAIHLFCQPLVEELTCQRARLQQAEEELKAANAEVLHSNGFMRFFRPGLRCRIRRAEDESATLSARRNILQQVVAKQNMCFDFLPYSPLTLVLSGSEVMALSPSPIDSSGPSIARLACVPQGEAVRNCFVHALMSFVIDTSRAGDASRAQTAVGYAGMLLSGAWQEMVHWEEEERCMGYLFLLRFFRLLAANLAGQIENFRVQMAANSFSQGTRFARLFGLLDTLAQADLALGKKVGYDRASLQVEYREAFRTFRDGGDLALLDGLRGREAGRARVA